MIFWTGLDKQKGDFAMKEVDFSNFNPKKNKGNGISFLRFESDKTYKVRPFATAVEFFKIFVGKGKPSLILDPDDKDEAAKLLTEHSGTEMRPSYRNAMFILDRNDNNRVKIMEGGSQIFEAFAAWNSGSGIKPGSGAAGDWQITVTGDGLNRKYSAVYLGPCVFTDEEKKTISALKAADKLKMGNYLKETPLDKVIEVAFGVTTTEPATVASAAADDDDFNF